MQLLAMPIAAPRDPKELDELAAILAAGLARVLGRKSSQILQREAKTPLDCEPLSGGDAAVKSEVIPP
jgi:hypothetical protein